MFKFPNLPGRMKLRVSQEGFHDLRISATILSWEGADRRAPRSPRGQQAAGPGRAGSGAPDRPLTASRSPGGPLTCFKYLKMNRKAANACGNHQSLSVQTDRPDWTSRVQLSFRKASKAPSFLQWSDDFGTFRRRKSAVHLTRQATPSQVERRGPAVTLSQGPRGSWPTPIPPRLAGQAGPQRRVRPKPRASPSPRHQSWQAKDARRQK